MKTIKKTLAGVLIIAILIAVFSLPASAQVPTESFTILTPQEPSRYYVGDAYFDYYTKKPVQEEIIDIYWNNFSNFFEGNKLIIVSLSDNFGRELVVPDEVDGVQIDTVILAQYTGLESVVLSDGIKKFVCFMQDEAGDGRISRKANRIKSLHVGKNFQPNGFYDARSTKRGRLENLETVTVSEENPYLSTYKGAVCSKDFSTFVYCPIKSSEKNYSLKKGTKIIADGAFAYNTRISIIKRIVQVEEIGADAFRGTKKIKEMTLGKKLKKISNGAFKESNLKKIVVGKNVSEIGKYAFANSKLSEITVKGNTKSIKKRYIFLGCKKLNFYVSSKTKAKVLKSYCNRERKKGYLVNGAKIYVGKKLHYTIKKK